MQKLCDTCGWIEPIDVDGNDQYVIRSTFFRLNLCGLCLCKLLRIIAALKRN